jgi:hypothetical protein
MNGNAVFEQSRPLNRSSSGREWGPIKASPGIASEMLRSSTPDAGKELENQREYQAWR